MLIIQHTILALATLAQSFDTASVRPSSWTNPRFNIEEDSGPVAYTNILLRRVAGRAMIVGKGGANVRSFTLYFRPDGAALDTAVDPDLFGAFQEQLGLRLEAARSEVEMLIVERAEKLPTEN